MEKEIQNIFPDHLNYIFTVNNVTKPNREEFFRPLFMQIPLKSPMKPNYRKTAYESLAAAPPPPPRKLSPEELETLEEQEERKLLELRVFLREVCRDLSKRRDFRIFTKPVDMDEVKDYLDVIKSPMDLETMLGKIDLRQYSSAKDFLEDINLICANALEYNPNKTSEDRKIRHCAVALKDYAHSKIKGEMDTDFEEECQSIAKNRVERSVQKDESVTKLKDSEPKSKPIKTIPITVQEDEDFIDVSELFVEKSLDSPGAKISIDKTQLEKLYQKCILVTKGCDVQMLAELYSRLLKVLMKYAKTTDRVNLIYDISQELKTFDNIFKPDD